MLFRSGLRLLEDFGNEYDLDKYRISIIPCYSNVELSIYSKPWETFKFHRDEVRIFRYLDVEMWKIKDLTELKDEIKNRIK